MSYQGGLFSAPLSNGIGDPYLDRGKASSAGIHNSKGVRQFGISRGIPGQFNRLFEGENHIETAKIFAKDRLKGKEKFLTPSGFKHSSPLKKSSSLGDYCGTFTKPFPHIPEGDYGIRGPREAIKEFAPKNIYTAPPRKACGAQATTPKICFTEIEYVTTPFDAKLQADRVKITETLFRI
jgi:hypothetical protein